MTDEEESDWYHPVDWRSEWDRAVEAEPWIIEPLVSPGRNVSIISKGGAGKSLLMEEISAAMATGREVLGQRPKPMRVLYIDHENLVRRDTIPRLKKMGYTADDLDLLSKNLIYLSFPSMEALDTPAGGERLLEAVERSGAKHVVIDTISRTIEGGENDNDTWLNLYKHGLKSLKAKGVGTTRLDHTGKEEGKGARGGSAKSGDVDLEWLMTADGDTLTLKRGKTRFEVADEVVAISRRSDPLRHELVAHHVPEDAPANASLFERVSRLLEQAPSGSTVRDVRNGVTGSGDRIGKAIQQLISEGYVGELDGKRISLKPYRDAQPDTPEAREGKNVVAVDFFSNVKEPKPRRRKK